MSLNRETKRVRIREAWSWKLGLRPHAGRVVRAILAVPVTVASAAGLMACDGILDADLPGVVDASVLDDPQLAPLMVNSVIADFECAYTNYTGASSAQSDEWWHTGGGQISWEWGGRHIDEFHENYSRGSCTSAWGVYTPVQTARFQAEDVFRRISEFPESELPGNKTEMLATVSAYAGYSYVLAGSNFCEMTFDGGPILQPMDVLAIAEERFLRAIQLAETAGNSDILNMARVGLARTRRGMGDLAGAADAARLVPEEYQKNVTRDASPPRRENRIFANNTQSSTYTVAPPYRDLEWKGVPDPRTRLEYRGTIGASDLPWYSQTKYPSLGSPLPLATWVEAQLIIAEAELEAGSPEATVEIINVLHARAGLPPFEPAEDGDIMEQLIEERAREFFLEGGHRLNDMLRYDIPLFSGIDHLGRAYGETTCWPLPAFERQ